MNQACVIGSPIDHSLSPAIFEFLSEKLNAPNSEIQTLVYEKKEIQPQHVQAFKVTYFLQHAILQGPQSLPPLGCNVTFPLKECVLEGETFLSKDVQFLKAANVIHFKDNKLYFHNTDWKGFGDSLPASFLQKKQSSVLLYGFGSTARAAIYALCQLPVSRIFICVREQAQKYLQWKDMFQKTFPNVELCLLQSPTDLGVLNTLSADLIINTLPFTAEVHENFYASSMPGNAGIYDMNYVESAFSHKFKTLNITSGLSMLFYQAIATWEIWYHSLEKKHKNDLHDEWIGRLK